MSHFKGRRLAASSLALVCSPLVLTALGACGSDAGPSDVPLAQTSSEIRVNTRMDDSEVKRMRSAWEYVENFLDSKAFQKACGSGLDGAMSTCLSAAQVDGDGTSTTPGCWVGNTCGGKYRRPSASEGQLLANNIARLAGLIRRNAFAAPAGSAASSENYTLKPDWPGATWATIQSELDTIGYHVQKRYDENMDRLLLVVEPKKLIATVIDENSGRNWGVFLLNTQPTNAAIIEVPHPKADLNSERLGAEAFEKGDALALLVAGAHRYALNTADSLGVETAFEVNGKADVANQASMVNPADPCTGNCVMVTSPNSGFQWAHLGLIDTPAPDGLTLKDRMNIQVIQFHGHRECTNTGDGLCTTTGNPNGAWGTKYSTYDNRDVVLSQGGKATTALTFTHLGVDTSKNTLIKAVRDTLDGATDPNDKSFRYSDGSIVRLDTENRHLGATFGTPTTFLSGHKNVQGTTSNAVGVKFLHVEVNGLARQVDYKLYTEGTEVKVRARDKIRPGSSDTDLTAETPKLVHLLARKITWAAEDWMSRNVGPALMPPALRLSALWKCPEGGMPFFGIDKDEYLDPDPVTIPTAFGGPKGDTQSHVVAWPNDSTMLAQAHRLGLKFAFYHLETSYYLLPNNNGVPLTQTQCTDVTQGGSSRYEWITARSRCEDKHGKNFAPGKFSSWSGHREQMERAGLITYPIYYAPVPCTYERELAGSCSGSTSQMPARLKETATGDAGSVTRYHSDAILDAREAYTLAEKQGFANGATIFLDVEDSNWNDGTTGIHAQTREYVRAWVYWFKQRQASEKAGLPQYSVGIYCGSYNCSWLKASLASMAGKEPSWFTTDYSTLPAWSNVTGGVTYWVHNNGCTNGTIDQCTNETCSTWTSGTYTHPPAGCSLPVKNAVTPLPGGSFDMTTWTTIASPFDPSKSAVADAFLWQYATTPADSSCVPGKGYTDNNSAALTIPGVRYQCRTPYAGDWQQYTHAVDMNSMDTSCVNHVPRLIKTSFIPKMKFDDIEFTPYASTLSNFLNSPNANVLTAAADLGEDPGFLVHLQSMYAAGGINVVDNRLVENVDHVSAPTPGNVVANPSFEDGMNGWTTTGSASSVWSQIALAGSKLGQVGQTTSAALDSTVAQTFTVPTSGARSLSFYYQIKCFDFGTQYDQFWVTLYDANTNTTFTLVPQTCSNDGSFKHYEFPLTDFGGHTLTLTARTHDDGAGNYPTYGWFDEVYVNTVGNGGFQSAGALSQWTTNGITSAYTHPAQSNPRYGTTGAQVGSSSPYTDSAMTQTFMIPSHGVSSLSFDRKVVCLDSVYYAWLTVTLLDNTTGKTHTLLAPTCTNNGMWEPTSFSVDTLAGHSVTLKFDVHDDNYPGDPIYALVDDVKLR